MADDATRVDISRLKRRRDFLRVAAERRKWVTPGLILQAAPMPRMAVKDALKDVNLDALAASDNTSKADTTPDTQMASLTAPAPHIARVGFTVSKKVGNAVQRNRARRRLRAAADQVLGRFATGETDYVIIGRTQTLDRPFEDLLKDLEKAVRRVLTAPKSEPYAGKRSPRRQKPKKQPKTNEPAQGGDR